MSLSPIRRGSEEHDDPVLSKAVKAGRRTYFFDVRATRSDDYFLTITESRKMTDARGEVTFDRHKIFLYKEDFDKFVSELAETIAFIRSRISDARSSRERKVRSRAPVPDTPCRTGGAICRNRRARISRESRTPDRGAVSCFRQPGATTGNAA